MPTYDFRCKCGEVSEVRAGYDAPPITCPACGGVAYRAPFCAGVSIRGATVAGSWPTTPEDRDEAERKDLKRKGWDGDRAMEFVRKGIYEDQSGQKQFSPALAEKKGG